MFDLPQANGGQQPRFGDPSAAWSAEPSADSILKLQRMNNLLSKKLGPEYLSSRTGPGGSKLTYIEGWRVMGLANEVFGYNGWSTQVRDISIDFLDYNEESQRWNCHVTALVRITLPDGCYHEDVGIGKMENAKSKADCLEKTKKEAVTDATKRTLRCFGSLMGNCIYDKQFLNDIAKVKPPGKQGLDFSSLHRPGNVYDDDGKVLPPGSKAPAGPVPAAAQSNQVVANAPAKQIQQAQSNKLQGNVNQANQRQAQQGVAPQRQPVPNQQQQQQRPQQMQPAQRQQQAQAQQQLIQRQPQAQNARPNQPYAQQNVQNQASTSAAGQLVKQEMQTVQAPESDYTFDEFTEYGGDESAYEITEALNDDSGFEEGPSMMIADKPAGISSGGQRPSQNNPDWNIPQQQQQQRQNPVNDNQGPPPIMHDQRYQQPFQPSTATNAGVQGRVPNQAQAPYPNQGRMQDQKPVQQQYPAQGGPSGQGNKGQQPRISQQAGPSRQVQAQNGQQQQGRAQAQGQAGSPPGGTQVQSRKSQSDQAGFIQPVETGSIPGSVTFNTGNPRGVKRSFPLDADDTQGQMAQLQQQGYAQQRKESPSERARRAEVAQQQLQIAQNRQAAIEKRQRLTGGAGGGSAGKPVSA